MTSLFSSPKAPAPIVVPQAPVVPTENTAAVSQAQQQELQASAARSGRASTIMSMNDISRTDRMGGD
jgi:hypothetical protein